jgi:hypothetical protein
MHGVVSPTHITLTNRPNNSKLKGMSHVRRLLAPTALLLAFVATPARAEEPEFQVVGTVEAKLVSLSILPRPGYRLHADAPVVVRLDGSAVELPRKLYRREDAVDPRAEAPRFEIAYRKTGAGARLDAEITFYICKATLCRPVVTRYGTSL